VSFLVLALIIAGVVLSSKAGWDELGLSEVSSHHAVPYDTYDDGATAFEFWVCGNCRKSFELEEVPRGKCPKCDIPMGKVKE
jgi:rubrerythrin